MRKPFAHIPGFQYPVHPLRDRFIVIIDTLLSKLGDSQESYNMLCWGSACTL